MATRPRRRRILLKILALDLASKKTGWGLLSLDEDRKITLEDYGLIEIKGEDLTNRLLGLWDTFPEVLRSTRPDLVVVEDAYYNPKRPHAFPALMQARAVISLICAFLGVPTLYITATSAKKRITGNGRAKKSAVMQAVKKRFKELERVQSEDVTDAVALGLAAALGGGDGLDGVLPQPVRHQA